MGKKVIGPASLKMSKDHPNTMKKRQLHSLIQVLRPKVYITDSSTFKTLVQELTGNASSSSPTPQFTRPETLVDNHGGDPEISSGCLKAFSDASLDSFEPCSYYPVSSSSSSPEEELFKICDTVYDQKIALEDNTTSVEYLFMNHQQQAAELLEYQDLDSWLLEMEPVAAYSSCNIVSGQQEVSVYDYEISGLI